MSRDAEEIKREVLEDWLRELVAHSDGAETVYRSSRDIMQEVHDIMLMEAADVYEFMRDMGSTLVDRGGTMKWRIVVRDMVLK